MATAKTKRKARTRKPRYRPVLSLPPLPADQYEALRQNIAVNGVMVPILVDSDGPIRNIIDGDHRKRIADELGYDCPEVVQPDLDEDEKRTLARALNLARRQLSTEQKRELIAEQLEETPERSNRWIGKMLGVSHPTVASVKADLASTGKLFQLDRTLGADGKYRPAAKPMKVVERTAAERKARIKATTLIHGDCRKALKAIATSSVDLVLTDPIYPEVRRAYGRISEKDWHSMMQEVVIESRRVLKPKGSAVLIMQPNY